MISFVERVLFLKSIDIFQEIPGDLLASVAQLATEHRFAQDAKLLTEGEQGAFMYVLVEGAVRVAYQGAEIAQLGARECVGEMSLLDAQPRSATVTAVQAVLALRVDQAPFFELMEERAELSRGVISVLSRRIRAMMRTYQPQALELPAARSVDLQP